MSANAFVDTNILVYAFAETGDDRHRKASELIDSLLAGEGASLSVQVLKGGVPLRCREECQPTMQVIYQRREPKP